MITLQDGRTFDGTPLQVVRQLQQLAWQGKRSLSEYIDWVVETTLRTETLELSVTGTTDEERATSLLDELVRTGLARR